MTPAHAQVGTRPDQAMANQIIQAWPATAKKSANEMIQKYGPPHEATASLILWHNNGPWKRTIVYREEIDHAFPMPHKDVLEQVIAYKVPLGRFDDLARYDGSVVVERTKGEMSARCDKEGANFLAINLAHDIVEGRRSVDEARRFYAEAIMKMMQGQPPAYTQKFNFQVVLGGTADPDRMHEMMRERVSGSPSSTR